MIQELARTLWYAFLIGLVVWSLGALAGLFWIGFRMMAGYR